MHSIASVTAPEVRGSLPLHFRLSSLGGSRRGRASCIMVVSTSCMLVHSSWSQYRYLAQVFCKLALVPAGTLLLVRGDMLIGFSVAKRGRLTAPPVSSSRCTVSWVWRKLRDRQEACVTIPNQACRVRPTHCEHFRLPLRQLNIWAKANKDSLRRYKSACVLWGRHTHRTGPRSEML